MIDLIHFIMKQGFWLFCLFIVTFAIILSACSSSNDPAAEATSVAQTLVAFIVQSRFATVAAETQATIPPTLPPAPTETFTEVPSATVEFAPLPDVPEAACIPRNTKREVAQVVNVVDGDTIDVEIDGQILQVRYIGMDAPERGAAFGEQSTQANRQLVEGRQVVLVMDTSEADSFGRLLRYVIVGNRFANYEMVRLGFAGAMAYEPDLACHNTFVEAEQRAATAGLGFWQPTATMAINVFSVQPTQAPQQGNCHPSYPDACIPPPPPDLDCGDVPHRRFTVYPPDPHRFDGDHDGIGCES